MSDFRNLLEITTPFSEFTPIQRSELISLAHHHDYREGEFVTLSGDFWPYLALIERGTFHALKESVEGRVFAVLTFGRGDVFWGLTFFDDSAAMPISLKVVRDGRMALWSKVTMLPFLKHEGEALWALCLQLVGRMQQASSILEDLAFQPVAGRLAKLLLKQYAQADSDHVQRDLTLDEMAARVGTTREMVCRILYRFADDQLIHITRTEFTLMDKTQLAKLAGDIPTSKRSPGNGDEQGGDG